MLIVIVAVKTRTIAKINTVFLSIELLEYLSAIAKNSTCLQSHSALLECESSVDHPHKTR
ncbi:MAG: hypothetical protein ACYTXP_24545 [Nostoc sp.]